ncbi:DUF1405 domain-containing protein [Macrococcoides canis]|uniref:DUF1405 domain-containing protein n=1 Tax=Macrococcoides canis TaxID=1855823 RepID=A0A1W7ACW2_9STAP|nr:DUF1405 domain-containing protein [Macrococcus canis]ARQ06940.1 hypothetical protein MCCS_12970 [Macrococcus canis]UJS26853.1 DUF1405 domain-containing protein [Macrococcus canis]UTH10551.1 DUF1405 domain-containing protein [Macrococcus canis]
MSQYYYWIQNKKFLIFIILCNIVGTIYGYYWYLGQLQQTKWYFMPFVPDSPTASLFLVIALTAIVWNRHLPLIEVLAFVTLIKYGVWAVVMNILVFITLDEVTAMGMMLIISHAIMAIQALLFVPLFRVSLLSIVIAAIWVFHNDVIDYVYMQYPVYSMLSDYIQHIGYFSFWLSVISFALLFIMKRDKIFD